MIPECKLPAMPARYLVGTGFQIRGARGHENCTNWNQGGTKGTQVVHQTFLKVHKIFHFWDVEFSLEALDNVNFPNFPILN